MRRGRNRIGVLEGKPRRESRYSDNSVEKFGSEGESRAKAREETEIQVESIF